MVNSILGPLGNGPLVDILRRGFAEFSSVPVYPRDAIFPAGNDASKQPRARRDESGKLVLHPASQRPIIENMDGSISTERKVIIGVEGKHLVIPTIWDGVELSVDDAVSRALAAEADGIVRFQRFDTPEQALAAEDQRDFDVFK